MGRVILLIVILLLADTKNILAQNSVYYIITNLTSCTNCIVDICELLEKRNYLPIQFLTPGYSPEDSALAINRIHILFNKNSILKNDNIFYKTINPKGLTNLVVTINGNDTTLTEVCSFVSKARIPVNVKSLNPLDSFDLPKICNPSIDHDFSIKWNGSEGNFLLSNQFRNNGYIINRSKLISLNNNLNIKTVYTKYYKLIGKRKNLKLALKIRDKLNGLGQFVGDPELKIGSLS